MIRPWVLALVGLLAFPAVVSAAQARQLEPILFDALNRARLGQGVEALAPHPVLRAAAADRARRLVVRPDLESTPAEVTLLSRRLWQEGYRPHFWREAVLAGDLEAESLARTRFQGEVLRSDLEHGEVVCLPRGEGETLCLVLVAERRVTKELRDAEPLRDLPTVRDRLLAEVNRIRETEGLRSLQSHPDLDRAAQAHAEAMLEHDFYDHDDPQGRSPRQRAVAAGYRPRSVAENLAKKLAEPEVVLANWLASSGHRNNLLMRRAVHHGAGVAVGLQDGDVVVFWCQILAAP